LSGGRTQNETNIPPTTSHPSKKKRTSIFGLGDRIEKKFKKLTAFPISSRKKSENDKYVFKESIVKFTSSSGNKSNKEESNTQTFTGSSSNKSNKEEDNTQNGTGQNTTKWESYKTTEVLRKSMNGGLKPSTITLGDKRGINNQKSN